MLSSWPRALRLARVLDGTCYSPGASCVDRNAAIWCCRRNARLRRLIGTDVCSQGRSEYSNRMVTGIAHLQLYVTKHSTDATSAMLPHPARAIRHRSASSTTWIGGIRRYIRAKQKLIKLLEEQKQAIIHRAVTRGLDPNVRLKPSGVDWLGDVPEHWDVRIKRVLPRWMTGTSPRRMAEYDS